MDEDRKIRFLVSPVVFLVSFLWGLALDPIRSVKNVLPVEITLPTDWPGLVALAAAGGSGVFALGVAIGTITYVSLRGAFFFFRFRKGRSHEIALSPSSLTAAWKHLGGEGDARAADEVFVGVSLDHGLVQACHEGIHKWIRRRWNAFSIAATSITAIVLSLVAGIFCKIALSPAWVVPALFMIVVFSLSATWAWRDSMAMLSLMTRVPLAIKEKK